MRSTWSGFSTWSSARAWSRVLARSSRLWSWNTWSRVSHNGGWNCARASNCQSGSLGDSDGLVVDNHMSWLRTVGGEVGHHNVGGDGDVRGGSKTGNGSSSSEVGELHSERKRLVMQKQSGGRSGPFIFVFLHFAIPLQELQSWLHGSVFPILHVPACQPAWKPVSHS